ncbi:MAG: metal-sensitive transcriptional regulator [Verrucomicrobia bacterium]|nr:MAG: metal-sensitive transcriptional regulator [Verrucomicrobiota bacterium]
MQTKQKDTMAKRMNRITGQIAGITRMIEQDRYCVDILNQISAARSALDALGIELLSNHLETCVVGHGTDSEHPKAKPMKPKQLLNELQTALSRFLK